MIDETQFRQLRVWDSDSHPKAWPRVRTWRPHLRPCGEGTLGIRILIFILSSLVSLDKLFLAFVNVTEREQAHNSWLGPPPTTQRPLRDRERGEPFSLAKASPYPAPTPTPTIPMHTPAAKVYTPEQ